MGRTNYCWKHKFGCPDEIINQLSGYNLPFKSQPISYTLENSKSVLETPENTAFIRESIEKYKKLGIISLVNFIPFCVNPISVKIDPAGSVDLFWIVLF